MKRVPLLASRKEQCAAIPFFGPEALVRPKFTTKCSQYMRTSALIYRRLKVGAANFLVHQWIEQQPSSSFAAGIEKRVPRWDKCLNVLVGCQEIEITVQCRVYILFDMKIIVQQHPFVGQMHFLFALCEYSVLLLHAISNWTKLSIPCGVISSTDVTIATSLLQNYQKMLEIEFSAKRISRIFNVSKIEKTVATGYLYMIRPS